MFPASVSCELCAAVTVLTLDLFSSGSHRDVQRSSKVKGRLHRCLQESGSGLQVRTGRLSCSPLIFGINTIWNKYSNTLLFFVFFFLCLSLVQRAGRLWVGHGELPEGPHVEPEPHPVSAAAGDDALPPRLSAWGHRKLQGRKKIKSDEKQ